jgi:hypothetical protein
MKDDDQTAKSPQEKKALSYAKDRRNGYGENDKSSRKAIPRRKAAENRGSRRKVTRSLSEMQRLDEAGAALVESSARNGMERVGGFKKKADIPLSEHLQRKLRRSIGSPSGQRLKTKL